MRTLTLALLLFASQTSAAPAPFRRAEKTPPPPQLCEGRWEMTWCGGTWDVELWGDGTYRGRCGSGGDWVGTYRYDRATRVLSVSESPDGGEPACAWGATLDARLSGVMPGGGRVVFRRR